MLQFRVKTPFYPPNAWRPAPSALPNPLKTLDKLVLIREIRVRLCALKNCSKKS
jgi:hypothetical protein